MMTTTVTFASIPTPDATVVFDVGLPAVFALLAVGTLLVVLLRGATAERPDESVPRVVTPRALRIDRAA
jgi:hypothetical protein